MAEKKEYELSGDAAERTSSEDIQVGAGADALAVQTNDPVYDAKARVLNRAVRTVLR